ncbi:MAG: hypothetical protein ACRCXK_05020 [Wohlfahrtiimonas sp.]
MIKIEAFQCEYCPKHYKHATSAKRHEKDCFRNPAVKACITCSSYLSKFDQLDDCSGRDEIHPTCNHFERDFEKKENGKYDLRIGCPAWTLFEAEEECF